MEKIKIRTTAIIVLMLQLSCTNQNSNKQNQVSKTNKFYSVDDNIVAEIDKSLKQFDSTANSSLFYRTFENEKVISENFIGNTPVPALAFTDIIDGAIAIDCLNGIDDGLGYSLIISKDTCFIRLHLLSKDSITFSNNMQSTPEYSLFVPSVKSKIILANDPEFSKEEIVQGYIELTSEYFYERTNNQVRKLKFELQSYFKSEPMSSKTGYKTLKKK